MIARTLLLIGMALLALAFPLESRAEDEGKADSPTLEKGKGLFVAVGYGGRRVSSLDGLTWENDTEWAANGGDDNNCLFSIAFGKGKFVAVGGGAGVGHVVMTRDGKNWQEVRTTRSRINPVVFGNERFLVGQGRSFYYSPDGENWTEGGQLDFKRGIYFRRAAFGNGVAVFCGDCDNRPGPRDGWRATTADGVKIESFVSDLPNTRSIAFGAGRFVLVGEKGLRETSVDGKVWEKATDPDDDFYWVFWTGKQFVLNAKSASYTSADGQKWNRTGRPLPAHPLSEGQDTFVGASWKTNLWASADCLSWKRTTTAGTNAITAIAFGVPTAAEVKKEPDWVAAMRKVHAKFTGEKGTFALFGDSITVSLAFWANLPYARKNMSPEDEAAYKLVNSHIKSECWNKWRGPAYGNQGSMTIRWADDNVDTWLKKLNPETALIMFGTNDLGSVPLAEYEKKLRVVVNKCLENGTVVILSTIPPRSGLLEKTRSYNDAVRKVARDLHVPLSDYFAECLARRPDDWDGAAEKFKAYSGYDVPTIIARDGVHPSNPGKYSGDYSEEGLKSNGFVLRNVVTLRSYAEVIRQVVGMK